MKIERYCGLMFSKKRYLSEKDVKEYMGVPNHVKVVDCSISMAGKVPSDSIYKFEFEITLAVDFDDEWNRVQ